MVSKPSRPSLAQQQLDSRAAGACISLPTADSDRTLVRAYSRELKIACDELYVDPFDAEARAQLIRLILENSERADAAKERLHGYTPIARRA